MKNGFRPINVRGDRSHARDDRLVPCPSKADSCATKPRIIAVGASTGGPGALVRLLKGFPVDFQIPIVIVQHMYHEYIPGFVSWLEGETKRSVTIPQHGDYVLRKTVYVAGAQANLEVSDELKFSYVAPPRDQLFSPNIDHFFTSLSKLKIDGCGILLTGMGDDGARGLKLLADHGWVTYAQSAESCAVDGMPDAAMKLSCRHHRSSPDVIAQHITTAMMAKPRSCYGSN